MHMSNCGKTHTTVILVWLHWMRFVFQLQQLEGMLRFGNACLTILQSDDPEDAILEGELSNCWWLNLKQLSKDAEQQS
jgi:hypothetical protein